MKAGEKYDESRISERYRDHALYIAYAPAEQPKIALAILVENGGHGGSVAGPIARTVFDYVVLGKEPKPPKDPRETSAPAAAPAGGTPASAGGSAGGGPAAVKPAGGVAGSAVPGAAVPPPPEEEEHD